MKLKNLIEIADKNTTIMLSGITDDGREIGFDFKQNIWLDNNDFTPGRVTSVGDFEKYRKYRQIMENRIEDCHIFRGTTIPQFEGIDIYHGKICKIKIYLATGKSEIRKSIEARVNLLAEKRMVGKKPPKPQTHRRKGGWSYAKRATPVIEGESNKRTKIGPHDLDN